MTLPEAARAYAMSSSNVDTSPQEAAVLTASALNLVFLVLNFVAVHVKFSHTTASHYELFYS